jgi:hypothetical protein
LNRRGVAFGVLMLLTLCACASPPAVRSLSTGTPSASPPSAQSAGAAPSAEREPASSGGAVAPATTTPAVDQAAYIASLDKEGRQMGYHPELWDGQRYYCRKHADLGTRIEHKECVAEAQFAAALHIMELNRQAFQIGHICNGNGCKSAQ